FVLSGIFLFIALNTNNQNIFPLVNTEYETDYYVFLKLNRTEFDINGTIIDDWAYLLQNINMDEINNSKYDLIVIDYSSDGCEEGEFSSENVSYMKSIGNTKKFLISYLSIGEAEDYRFYWNSSWTVGNPIWLDAENPDWPGNYKVKYWYVGWQNIIFEYLDRIILAGFDGIYMDIIDAYDYYNSTIPHADWLMMDFVINISQYAKSQVAENFTIFVQNADELLSNSTYLDNIDGIAREDVFYLEDEATDDTWRQNAISNLSIALAANKTVLVVDYPTPIDLIYDSYSKCVENGFLPYVAGLELDALKYYAFYPAT
ncbi:MAG: MJ1477/TM1410 family putative glycoside hydrolase, partial [Promethearchaeota archaeon]